jgi:hypothetical protein
VQYEAGERRDFPCQPCPEQRFPPIDGLSQVALEAHRLAVSLTPEMGAPPLEFIFKILDIPVPSPEAREITERLVILWRTHQEHHAKQNGQSDR